MTYALLCNNLQHVPRSITTRADSEGLDLAKPCELANHQRSEERGSSVPRTQAAP